MRCDALAGKALDAHEQPTIGVMREGQGEPLGAGSTGAADAVDVVCRNFRQVVVDHMADTGHVEPACGHISRYEDADAALFRSMGLPVPTPCPA